MSNFTRSAYHPKEQVIRAANWLDDHFGPHRYGVKFPGDPHVYRPQETEIPLDVVFVPKERGGASCRVFALEKRVRELEAELLATQKWAKRMGYVDLQERLGKALGEGKGS